MSLVFDNALGICNVKFTEDEAKEILAEHEDGRTITQIAQDRNVDYNRIYRIVTGATFGHLAPKRKLRDTNTETIVYMIEQGFSSTAVAQAVGLTSQAVGRVYKRETGRTISEFRKTKMVRYGEKP